MVNVKAVKHYSAVVSLFGEMWKLGIPTDKFILNIVINSYCLMHHADLGFSVLAIFFKTGIPFDVVTFTILIRGLFAENNVKDAIHLFKKLARENICEPNEVMYATVMNRLSKRAILMLDAVISLLKEMIQKGIPPNIVTYSSLIDGLCKSSKWDDVRILFCEMGLFEAGRIDTAQKFFAEMLSVGQRPDFCTHRILLSGYFKNGRVKEAMSLFHKLERKFEETDIQLYGIVIDGLCKNVKFGEAHLIFEKLFVIGLHPNVVIYTTMINGFCQEGF
ncbi:PREDICTED: pentatricopeptide repeat-containing protein At1g62910-like [Nicotiana attenuata]|uniref:pentatricopeptide repeat-containing protein At1g62910-like n=1 Tax=Nicotiana attenuata TaxID=49451 RepID=UPI000905534B|nr:PREDICTED: pentatricopeptide repeat-containing protein At1g62910-like [Nicotiana attenuata]